MKAGSFVAFASIVMGTVLPVATQQPVPNPPSPPPQAPAALTVPNPLAGQAPAALTVPNPLSGLQPGPRDLYQLPDGSDRFQHLAPFPQRPVVIIPGPYFPGPYYFPYVPYAPYGAYTYPTARDSRAHMPRMVVERGRLVLDTLPDAAQVLVDGFYVGLAEEFGLRGRALDLPIGSHRVELRAPGYEPLSFNVIIAPNDIVRYRGDMQALPSTTPPRPPQPPAVQKSVYLIANCYAGNKPPTAALPRGCDAKKLETRK
jgi:hypothetical protein